ncbi:uncharacterized protein LOC143283739 isoform X2 [Babylonia areolata]|uniref:uncharacterized protein LOC143283739 isoform X2 n=1 Tax=Babylonia areolata TaxID=304850 RepID=UPI003FD4D030
MAGRDLHASGPSDRTRLRYGTNRQVEMSMQKELHDVAQKSLSEIAAKKEQRINVPLTDDQRLCLRMVPELKMEKKREERRSVPVYHDDLKAREVSKEQMLLLPHVPPTNPPDKAAHTVMESRTRKYPYAKKELVTTDVMKKPKVSSVGIVPFRSSFEVDSMRVMVEGESHAFNAMLDEIDMASRAQDTDVPPLDLDDVMGDDPTQQTAATAIPAEPPVAAVPEKLRKPAILSSLGTTSTVTLTQRAKPVPKLRVKPGAGRGASLRADVPTSHSALRSARSMQSSLMSDEIVMPDENVYSKYDDAIAAVDADVETAVGATEGAAKGTDSPGIKSVKQLLEEAKMISGPGASPLYKAHLKPPSAGSARSSRSARSAKSAASQATSQGRETAVEGGRRSGRRRDGKDRRKSASKSAANKAAGKEDPGTTGDGGPQERSVDEIVAALKLQASSGVLSEADKKIQEIMDRVMARTISDADDTASVGTPEPPAASETGEGTLTDSDGRVTPSSTLADDRMSGMISPSDLEESQRDMNIPAQIPEEEEPDFDALSIHTARTGDTLGATTDISVEQPLELQVPPPVKEETTGVDKPEEDVDLEVEEQMDIQQAWQDLMAPAEVTYEELMNVTGDSLDFHTRGIPGPTTGHRPNVNSSSVSFLSTWAPTAVGAKVREDKAKTPEPPTRNIHHFCKMTSDFQLPREFRNTGRKYHAPDLYRGVFPPQQYRFEEETLRLMEETDEESRAEHEASKTGDLASAAAQRIVDEANRANPSRSSLENWKAKAEKALSHAGVTITGQRIQPGTDESRVYWAPAPPKLEVAPAKVRQLLFPQYQSGEVDEFGRLVLTAPVEPESESEEEEEEESPEEVEKRMQVDRILTREHQSCEDLTYLMKMEIRREEMIRDGELDPHSYRPFVSPPPTPEEEPDPKAVKTDPRTGKADPKTSKETGKGGKEATRANREKGGAQSTAPEDDEEEGEEEKVKPKILGPYDETLFGSVYFPAPRRSRSLPRLLADLDDTLMVPLDFNAAMEELREQRQLIEKAKRQRRLQEAEDELATMEEAVGSPIKEESPPPKVDILRISRTPKKEEELTPAEKALMAGRSYVILPKKKKKPRVKRPLDMARLEAIEKFLSVPPNKLTRHNSLPKLKQPLERELRVPQRVRHREGSLPDLLNFDKYKKSKRMPKEAEEREWVRDIWNRWFDEVFPSTPVDSEDDFDDTATQTDAHTAISSDTHSKDDKKKGSVPEILSEEIHVIETVADTEENAEVLMILRQEVEKLTQLIDSMTPPMAFDLARRGALYRKLGLLHKASEDLNRAIKMEPMLLDAYWHRHLLYVLQDKKAAALDDLNYIMKNNKSHAGAYRSMAEIYRRQGDITMAIVNYTQAIKINPTDHDAYFQRAEMYEQRGEKLLALEDYSNCMKLMPTRIDAIMKHGLYYFQNENWPSAINDFTELLRVDPLNSVGRLYRGRAYAKMNQWTPAVEDLSAAIHLDPTNWQAFYQRACVLRKAHPKRALQDYSMSLLINDGEENIMSYLHRGILYNAQSRPEDAIPDFEAVLKLNKDIACAHVNLGLIFMTKHQNYHRAIKKFTSAIKVDPTYVRAYVCRGEAYHKIHELKLALKDFTRAIHLRPDVHHYYMFRGQLVLELGNLELAAFCVRHASEMGGQGNSSAFGDRPTQQAAVQSFLKNYDKAIDALVQATRVKPVMPLFMLLGKTQMKAKQFQEAAASFEKALDLMRPWKQRDPWPAEAAEAHFLSGMCHMEMRSYLPALNSFNNAISQDVNYAEAYYQRGLARMKLKQSKGIQDFNRALAINPNIFQAYLSRACYYGLKGVYTKAILNCNEAIKLQPNSLRAYLYRGSLKYHIKAFDLAIRDLTKASSIDNTCPLPYFNRAVCYQENKQYTKALTDYGIVLLLGEQLSLKVLINRGLLYFEQQDYINALYDFQNASKLSANDHRIHHTLGLCFHKLGRLQEAVTTFTQCLNIKPFFLDGLIARGNVFMDYGHEAGIVQARRDFQRALRLDPTCLAARVNLAYTLQVCGKLMQAWRNFTIAVTMKGTYKPALEGRAIVNLQMSNTFAAFQDISTSIHIAPTAELLTNRGVINQFMNDRVNAMRDYQRAIDMDPKYALAYFNAANVYFHTRHFKQALTYYNKAIEHNPKDESALLNRAITKVLLRDSRSALEDFRQAIKLSPHSAHIYFNRANLYAAMGQDDRAEKDYTKALTLQPDDPLTLKRRADVRGKLGRQEEAIEDYRRAIDIQTRPNQVVQPHPPDHPPPQPHPPAQPQPPKLQTVVE